MNWAELAAIVSRNPAIKWAVIGFFLILGLEIIGEQTLKLGQFITTYRATTEASLQEANQKSFAACVQTVPQDELYKCDRFNMNK